MISRNDILTTLDMIDKRHLDIRTITMGISLLDCCDPDLDRCCGKNDVTKSSLSFLKCCS